MNKTLNVHFLHTNRAEATPMLEIYYISLNNPEMSEITFSLRPTQA